MGENITPKWQLISPKKYNNQAFEASPPEIHRGEALTIRSDSPHLAISRGELWIADLSSFIDPHVEVKNSTICFEREAKNLDSLSGLLLSTELSPIAQVGRKMPSSSFSTYNMTYTTEMEESSGSEDRPDVIRNSQGETKFDFCFSPIQMQRPKSPQMMSAVYEVTEPLSERTNVFDTKMQTLANHKEGDISPIQNTPKAWQVADIGEPDDGEVDENIPITPEDHLLRNSESLTSRMAQLLWAPMCSPSKEISEGSDDFDCSSGETSPPIMRLYVPKDGHGVRAVCSPRYEQEVQWKSTQTENVSLTVDKGTQTVEECEVPVYPDVTDNADATRLKAWIEELFKHKLPRADSQVE